MELGGRIFGEAAKNADTKICSLTKWTVAKKTTRSYISYMSDGILSEKSIICVDR